MKLSSLFVPAVVAAIAAAENATLQYDTIYDLESESFNGLACSNGLNNGGCTTFGSLPSYPYIGAFDAIASFNAPECGTCWNIAYTNDAGEATTLNVLAIDHAEPGLIIVSEEAMDELTDGNAVFLVSVPVTAVQVDKSLCGL
ncbi:Asp f 13-like protein [Rhodocollybia butyracea]|uniref:Asp f 13-like protein n=1 Tax=Rhodocollybia butyracea TaxID=206335 RepID=A0A9P5PZJ3_9AGAR|nr:Asp f 13-like protein [Rhodocollybia butyracea]